MWKGEVVTIFLNLRYKGHNLAAETALQDLTNNFMLLSKAILCVLAVVCVCLLFWTLL